MFERFVVCFATNVVQNVIPDKALLSDIYNLKKK